MSNNFKPPATPVRKGPNRSISSTTMNTRERQADAEAAVNEDLHLHYRTTDTGDFISQLLYVDPKVVAQVLNKMETSGNYNTKHKRWQDFPNSKGKDKEVVLYEPFRTAAEAIRVAAQEASQATSEMGPTSWVRYESKSPKSYDNIGAKLRADVLLALDIPEGGTKAVKDIWWLQIVAAVEMKRSDAPTWTDVVKQLMLYLRRTLREQLDRRFVFGLTIGPDMMTMCVYDRCGVLGTRTAFNIHKEPAKFIQVIAALSILSPERLGFDTTMKLFISPNVALPPYRPTHAFLAEYNVAPYNRRWVIKMNSGTQYLTVRTVSSIRAEIMRGRGVLIWVVVRYGETNSESSNEIFVLKQSWSPRGVMNEYELYEAGSGSECGQIAELKLCEEVQILGQPDTTDKLIRGGLDDSTGLGKRTRTDRRTAESSDPFMIVPIELDGNDEIQEIIDRSTGPPVSRVRIRVVMSTFGWQIKHLSTIRELVQVLRDAIQGHKHLYTHGVLHRDVSTGNILVEWRRENEGGPSNAGRLIDLDHAKQGKTLSELQIVQPEDDTVDDVCFMLRKKNIERDVAFEALRFCPVTEFDPSPPIAYISAAIKHSLEFRGLSPNQACTTEHLGWTPVNIGHSFEFDATEVQKGSRTGTLPFLSGEILSEQRYFGTFDNDRQLFHDAVHDLESFWWVLLYICLTRQGQGGARREELEDEVSPLRQISDDFFGSRRGSVSGQNKSKLFNLNIDLENRIFIHFHHDFDQLKPLIVEWFHLLRLAYRYRAFEYHHIHDMVLEILDKVLLSMGPDNINDSVTKVLEKRKDDIEGLRSNPHGNTHQLSPPDISPSNKATATVPTSAPSSPTPNPAQKRRRR